jgi:hypothetical protein
MLTILSTADATLYQRTNMLESHSKQLLYNKGEGNASQDPIIALEAQAAQPLVRNLRRTTLRATSTGSKIEGEDEGRTSARKEGSDMSLHPVSLASPPFLSSFLRPHGVVPSAPPPLPLGRCCGRRRRRQPAPPLPRRADQQRYHGVPGRREPDGGGGDERPPQGPHHLLRAADGQGVPLLHQEHVTTMHPITVRFQIILNAFASLYTCCGLMHACKKNAGTRSGTPPTIFPPTPPFSPTA